MEEVYFKELFQQIVGRYALPSEAAEELLQRILAILKNAEDDHLPTVPKYEILLEQSEREDEP